MGFFFLTAILAATWILHTAFEINILMVFFTVFMVTCSTVIYYLAMIQRPVIVVFCLAVVLKLITVILLPA